DPGAGPVRGLVPHLERRQSLALGVRDRDTVDTRAARAVEHQVDQPADRGLLTLQMGFDRAVVAVADPAGDAVLLRGVPRPATKEHPLHSPGDAHVPRD